MPRSSRSTRASLLARLRNEPGGNEAWGEFVEAYGPVIGGWCRKWGLQEADAQDVTQGVLLRLAQRMKSFSYDERGSFRAYLHTLTRYALSDFFGARSLTGSGDSRVIQSLHEVSARDDLVAQLNEQFDHELLGAAMDRVKKRVEPHTWDAFCLTAVDGLSGAEAGEKLGMKVATVFKAKSKVQQMLRDELSRLDSDADHSQGGAHDLLS